MKRADVRLISDGEAIYFVAVFVPDIVHDLCIVVWKMSIRAGLDVQKAHRIYHLDARGPS
jgi:hypothetical protein